MFILLSLCLIALVFFHYYFDRKASHIATSPSRYIETSIQNKGDVCKEKTNSSIPPNLNQEGWGLIWHDEFDSLCLSSSKWNIEDWAANKNNELQYYSPDNVKVENGVLTLTSRQESFKGRDYTSGAVHTQGKFDFLYGKAEMRAKLPAGQGIFPAFWMMTDKEETWLPEIDIMEMLGHRPDEIWMVHHWLDSNGNLQSNSGSFKGSNFSTDYHTFGIEWTPDSITWFIDGVERFKSEVSVPNERMYLYLNTAVGGIWPGDPDHTTVFPVQFDIDYVRVYEKKGE
ncbi:glycoside hydrolase family 16 protein [Radiobacillus deserti]|uniref:Glycoside hydrolase family 16 protein n=2 Tax=Radiobacillus deserti TaxID=2594883 RepID=A0A516KLJ6_9BACI|nr:glycoside hydrolase family 16 protein [Radiobacillus deserti]